MAKNATIKLFHATTAGALPPAGSLTAGELALDSLDSPPHLYTLNGGGTVIDLLSDGAPTLPLSIANGGTGATTGAGAFDNLSGTSGATAGWLNRNAAGQWVMTNPAGLFAPLNNPANGQNNYLPINNPTFTGTLTAPTGGSWSASGIVNVPTLGIGTGVPTTNAPVAISGNVNSDAFGITMTNQSGGNLSSAVLLAINNVGRGIGLYMTGSAFVSNAVWAFTNAGQLVCGGPLSIATSNDVTNNDPIRFFVGSNLQGRFDRGGLTIPLGRSIGIGTPALVTDPGLPGWTGEAAALGIFGVNMWDGDSCVVVQNTHSQGLGSYYAAGSNGVPKVYITRWSVPNAQATIPFAALYPPSSNFTTNCPGGYSWSFYDNYPNPNAPHGPNPGEFPPSMFLTSDGLNVPHPFGAANTGLGCWMGNGNIGCYDVWPNNTRCWLWMGNDHPDGWATIEADAGGTWVKMEAWGVNDGSWTALESNATGGLWIQSWMASPAGGIHFTVGNRESGEIFEQIDIDEHGLHLNNTWHDDDKVTLDDSKQAGIDVPAGGEVMLGTGAGLLMLTATSTPHSTALFLLGNQFARLITDTSGNGWADGLPPAPQGKLLVFCRDGKYYVSNGRAQTVHLNDMMFKNAEN